MFVYRLHYLYRREIIVFTLSIFFSEYHGLRGAGGLNATVVGSSE